MSEVDVFGRSPLRDRIAIVVLTYNRRQQLAKTISRLTALPEQLDIAVVDNGSTDGTGRMVREQFPSITLVALPENRGAAGRNAGIAALSQPYIALTDDDTWWEDGSLATAARILDENPCLAVVVARVLVGRDNRLDLTCAAMAESPIPLPEGTPGTGLVGFLAGASVIRRSAFLEAGGFEPHLFLGAEEQLASLNLLSAGWSLSYIDQLVVHHDPSPLRDATKRSLLLARNHLWVAWLRRPMTVALRQTLELARSALRDPVSRRALAEAVYGLPWALQNRKVVSRTIEQQLRLVQM